MANTGIKNDSCYVKQQLVQSGNIFTHVMNPAKYNNRSQCRPILGIVGGNNVSRTSGNMVDLESDLRGQTRVLSNCDSTQYKPSCNCANCTDGMPCGCLNCQEKMNDLPACQLQNYKPTVTAPAVPEARCGYAPKAKGGLLGFLFG